MDLLCFLCLHLKLGRPMLQMFGRLRQRFFSYETQVQVPLA